MDPRYYYPPGFQMPPGNYPPGSYPPSSFPQSGPPPGSYPPGSMPPTFPPYGQMPPGYPSSGTSVPVSQSYYTQQPQFIASQPQHLLNMYPTPSIQPKNRAPSPPSTSASSMDLLSALASGGNDPTMVNILKSIGIDQESAQRERERATEENERTSRARAENIDAQEFGISTDKMSSYFERGVGNNLLGVDPSSLLNKSSKRRASRSRSKSPRRTTRRRSRSRENRGRRGSPTRHRSKTPPRERDRERRTGGGSRPTDKGKVSTPSGSHHNRERSPVNNTGSRALSPLNARLAMSKSSTVAVKSTPPQPPKVKRARERSPWGGSGVDEKSSSRKVNNSPSVKKPAESSGRQSKPKTSEAVKEVKQPPANPSSSIERDDCQKRLVQLRAEMDRSTRLAKRLSVSGQDPELLASNVRLQQQLGKHVAELEQRLVVLQKAVSPPLSSPPREKKARESGDGSVIKWGELSPILKSEKSIVDDSEVVHQDGKKYWCNSCSFFCGQNINNVLLHIRSSKHKGLDPKDKERHWATPDDQKANSDIKDKQIAGPIKGLQFGIPVPGFYCSLCEMYFGSLPDAEFHYKGNKHNQAYKVFTSKVSFHEELPDYRKLLKTFLNSNPDSTVRAPITLKIQSHKKPISNAL